MKIALLASVVAALAWNPAQACRALWEYPAAMEQLAKADMAVSEKSAIQKELDQGWALHQRGQELVDPALMKESVDMLDRIKARLGR